MAFLAGSGASSTGPGEFRDGQDPEAPPTELVSASYQLC